MSRAGKTEASASRARRARLSHDRILAAAQALADSDGIEAVSMRRVAQALGVEAMSLYNHVRNKEELLDGMVEQVAAEFVLPLPGGDWKAAMLDRAASMHAALLRHPWAPPLLIARVNAGPAMLRHVEATLACLDAAGFDPVTADHAWNAMDSFIYGFAVKEIAFPFAREDYAASAREHMHLIPGDTHPRLHALAQMVAEGAHDGVHDPAFGLGLILDGLDALRRACA